MKRIIGIFTAFLLPALPTFGASSEFGSFKGFKQTYDSCRLDVNSDSMSLEISNLPEKYQTMYKNHAKETVTTATQGKCNGVAYTCKPGDLVTCNPCEMFFYFQEIKELYIENTIEEKCGHLKKTTNKTNSTATTTKQNTKTEPENNFDFVAEQKKDRAAWETGNDAPTYQGSSKNTTTKKQTKKNTSDDYDELQRVGEIHAADAEADAERSQPKQTKKQEPDFDFAAASANDMNATVARSGLGNTLAPEPTTPEKSERQKQIEENTKKSLTVQPKPEKKKADTVFEISGNFEIDNGTMPSNVAAKLSPATCKSVGSKYISGKKFTKGYQCPAETTSVTFTFITEDAKANAKYNIENSTQTVQLSGKKKYTLEKTIKFVTKKATCDWSTHYLDSKKNKCVAKSTIKCANGEVVNNAGECQKNVSVNIQKPGDMTGHEWTETDRERMKCDKEKKHTKWENNKCVCESADYEMQSDGYCTLKRAKCLKQRNTKYENGRCVCTSADFEMGADNNCTMTDAASVTADKEAAEIAFACSESGGTMNDQGECECGKGYKPDGQGACEPNKRTLSNEEKKKLCEKEGAGTWTNKNKCECTNKTHSFDDEVGCTENKNKVKRAEKETANNHKKELCTEPNKWNDTLKKCTCKDKKQFFDEETGCVSATADFLAAETELNTLKQQFETKKAELASAE